VKVGGGGQATAKATAKAKYGGLSTAAANAPPSVEMTAFVEWVGENRQQQRQGQQRIPAG